MKAHQPVFNRIALWIIAVSLLVIAACLVWMAIQQNRRDRLAREEAPAIEPQAIQSAHSWTPPNPRETTPTKRRDSKPPAPAQPVVPPTPEPVLAIEQSVVQTVATEPAPGGALLPLATATPTNGAAVITGRVVLNGRPPPETSFTINDPSCGKNNGGKFTTRNYVVSRDGGLANVFVHVRSGLEEKNFPLPEATVLTLSNCQFEPYVVGLMTNQFLEIQNLNKGRQDVLAVGRGVNPEQSLALFSGKTARIRFGKPQIPVTLISQTRPLERAYMCVVDNPFFAVTDADGNFSISNVPPGDYVIQARHLKALPEVEQSVSITAGATVTANFIIQAPGTLASARK